MTSDDPASDDPFQAMMAERYAIVAKLTELNSAHLSREGRRAGVEFEMAHCRQLLAAAPSGVLRDQLVQLEREHREVIEQAKRIESEREALIQQLEDIVNRLNAPQGGDQE